MWFVTPSSGLWVLRPHPRFRDGRRNATGWQLCWQDHLVEFIGVAHGHTALAADKILIVTGPSDSGKTAMIEQVLQDRCWN